MTATDERANAYVVHGKLPARISIHCTGIGGCGTLSRVYRVEPTTQIGAFKFCPVCGARIMPYLSTDDTGWEALAIGYGMSVEAMRAVYAGWNPHEYYRFSDYVDAIREEARTGVRPPPKPSMHQSIPIPPVRPRPRMKLPTR
jgi:hypothetical protein